MDTIGNNLGGLPWGVHVVLTCVTLFVHRILNISSGFKTGLEWFLIVGSCILMAFKLYDETKKRIKKYRNEK